MVENKKPLIGIIGGKGKMGNWFKKIFEKAGLKVLVSDKKTILTNKELAKKADIIIVSAPIRKTGKIIKEIRSIIRKDALLCDITSLKIKPVSEMKKARSGALGMHPLFGPSVSHLKGQTIVFCPIRNNQWVKFLKNIFIKSGGKIVEISPEEHDFQMALIQSLIHFVNISLARTLKSYNVSLKPLLSTPSFCIQSLAIGRILEQGVQLSCDIELENPYFKKILKSFLKNEKKLADDVINKNYINFEKKIKNVIQSK